MTWLCRAVWRVQFADLLLWKRQHIRCAQSATDSASSLGWVTHAPARTDCDFEPLQGSVYAACQTVPHGAALDRALEAIETILADISTMPYLKDRLAAHALSGAGGG